MMDIVKIKQAILNLKRELEVDTIYISNYDFQKLCVQLERINMDVSFYQKYFKTECPIDYIRCFGIKIRPNTE